MQEDDLAHGDLRHSLLRTIAVLNSMANVLPCVGHIIYIYMCVCMYIYNIYIL